MAVARLPCSRPATTEPPPQNLSDEVELYQRTYSTLLRSSGETRLRVLESSHMAMGSSLHPLADSDEIDLGAFIYAIRRLPDSILRTTIVVMGQEAALFTRAGIGPLEEWEAVEAPRGGGAGTTAATRCWPSCWRRSPTSTTSCRRSSPSRSSGTRSAGACWPPAGRPSEGVTAEACAAALGGAPDDWARLADAWGAHFEEHLQAIAERGKSMRLRMLGGTQVGYQRMTRRWWAPVRGELNKHTLGDAPLYFASSNTHSLSNLVTGLAREREDELVAFVERGHHEDLQEELARFRDGRTDGAWENFLYFVARDFFDAGGPELRRKRHEAEVAAGVEHIRSKTALRVPAQVIPLARLDPARLDPRLGSVDAERLARSEASSSTPTTRSAWPPTTCCARSPSTPPTCAASTSWARRRRSTPTSAT